MELGMREQHGYRPVERCVLRMSEAGLDDAEIGARLGRSPGYPARVRRLSALHEDGAPPAPPLPDGLRPLERTVLNRLAEGVGYDELARRFHRQTGFVEFVESLAYYKLER
jgi:DNA-binding CsgD family transcriptional regulator